MTLSLKSAFTAVGIIVGLAATGAWAGELATNIDSANLPVKKQTTLGLYLTSAEAHDYVTGHSSVLFVDVRTRAEVNFIGWADDVDANIPFKYLDDGYQLNEKGTAYLEIDNDNFGFEIDDLVAVAGESEDPIIILMCRSGARSARAVDILADYGYTRVYSVVDGFEGDKDKATGKRTVNGWKNAGLPWHYGLDVEKIYHQPES